MGELVCHDVVMGLLLNKVDGQMFPPQFGVVKKRSLSLFFGACLYLSVIWLLTFYVTSNLQGNFLQLLLLHPVIFILTIGFILKDYSKQGYWFSISNFMLVLIYIYMGLGSLNYIIYFPVQNVENLKFPETAITTFWLVCLSAVIFRIASKSRLCTYFASVFPSRDQSPKLTNRMRMGLLLTVSVSLLAKIYMIRNGQYGFSGDMEVQAISGYDSILTMIDQICYVAVMMGFYYWYSGYLLTNLEKIILVASVGILLVFALMYGMKAKVLHLILIVILPAILIGIKEARQIIPFKTFAIIGILFASFWIVNPLIRAAMLTTQSNTVVEAVANMGLSMYEGVEILVASSGGDGLFAQKVDVIWERLNLFEFFNSVVAQVGHGDTQYRYWEGYEYLPVSFIPRLILPDKPLNNYSAQFNLDYISNVYNSSTPSVIGWSYMESGISSMVILMGVLGFLYGTIDAYCFRKSRLSLFGVLIFGIFFIKIANLEPGAYWIISGLSHVLYLLILSYFMLFLCVRYGKKE